VELKLPLVPLHFIHLTHPVLFRLRLAPVLFIHVLWVVVELEVQVVQVLAAAAEELVVCYSKAPS
jgi:hypothetical protein